MHKNKQYPDSEIRQRKPSIPFENHDSSVLDIACSDFNEYSPEILAERLNDMLDSEKQQSNLRINLVASESLASPKVLKLLSDPIGGRMGGGQIGKSLRLFPHCDQIDSIESYCIETFKKLFGCQNCEYRLVTNMLAINLVYMGFTKADDRIMSFDLAAGGDTSNTPFGPPGLANTQVYKIPFDFDNQEIIFDEFETIAKQLQPGIVAISKTISLFDQNLQSVKSLISEWDGLLFVDAAHELGLIAGGVISSPFDQGADLVSGSIGKSFSGPQSGVLLWNNSQYNEVISRTAFPMLVSSYQINRVAAMTLAGLELLKFGKKLMERTVKNAKYLANELHKLGVPVLFEKKGFTETHQLVIDAEFFGGGSLAARELADIGISSNQIILSKDTTDKLFNPSGLRLGTTYVSRQGMGEIEMTEIARLISDRLFHKRSEGIIKREVESLAREFNSTYYTFETGIPS